MKTCCLPPEVEIWGAIEVVVAEVPGGTVGGGGGGGGGVKLHV